MSTLKTAWTEKTVHTRHWTGQEAAELFASVSETINEGEQVIVIYPSRSTSMKEDALPSAEEALSDWSRHFPGRVRLAHGEQGAEQNNAALDDIRNRRADILVATTVVETGIDLPDVRRITVVHAERFGATALHQLRGRVARKGGEGWCDLFTPRQIPAPSQARLNAIVKYNDGFKIAEIDAELRGFGDLASGGDRQHGGDCVLLFGRALRPKAMDNIIAALSEESNRLNAA